jgi:hypothetical protein
MQLKVFGRRQSRHEHLIFVDDFFHVEHQLILLGIRIYVRLLISFRNYAIIQFRKSEK